MVVGGELVGLVGVVETWDQTIVLHARGSSRAAAEVYQVACGSVQVASSRFKLKWWSTSFDLISYLEVL